MTFQSHLKAVERKASIALGSLMIVGKTEKNSPVKSIQSYTIVLLYLIWSMPFVPVTFARAATRKGNYSIWETVTTNHGHKFIYKLKFEKHRA